MVTRRHVVRLALSLPFLGFGRAAASNDGRYYVVGFVMRPGAYVHKDDLTVADALETAGGLDPRRTVTTIAIIRIVNGEKETHAAGFNDPVLAGDTISAR